MGVFLELSVIRSTWERYYIANVLHTCHEEDKALESETETCVWTATETAGVKIPFHILHWNVTFLDFVQKLVITFLTNRTTDNLTNLWEENVSSLYGWSHLLTIKHRILLVYLHIESLDSLWIVGHDDRLLEVLLNEEALVLGSKVVAPVARELEFLAILDGLLQDLDALGVRQMHEAVLQHTFETLDERGVDEFVEELKLLAAVVESPAYAMLDEVLYPMPWLPVRLRAGRKR